MKLRFTPSGRMQFLAANAYIQRDDPPAALKFRKRAEQVLRRLLRFPESGRLIPEFPDLPFREVVVPPYRCFYRREGKVIWVVAAWHGAVVDHSVLDDFTIERASVDRAAGVAFAKLLQAARSGA